MAVSTLSEEPNPCSAGTSTTEFVILRCICSVCLGVYASNSSILYTVLMIGDTVGGHPHKVYVIVEVWYTIDVPRTDTDTHDSNCERSMQLSR